VAGRLIALAAALVFVLAPIPAVAQQSTYVAVAAKIDRVQGPQNLFNAMGDCSSNPLCTALVDAMSAYFQIPLDQVVAVGGMLSTTRQGQGGNMTIRLPQGYAYCSSEMKMVSIVPHDGPKGSLFLGEAKESSLFLETWTPTLSMFDGRSWVEANLTVIGVRQDLASTRYQNGTCQRPNRHLWYCRGGGCIDTQDRGQDVDVRTPPSANSRK